MSTSLTPCDHCGLPLPRGWWSVREAEGPRFCCYGCRLAAGLLGGDDTSGGHAGMVRLGLAVFFGMNVMAFTMALWTPEVYGDGGDHRLGAPILGLFRWLVFFFSLPVFGLLGLPLAEATWQGLRRGVLSTDLLLLTGVAASFVISLPALVNDRGLIYFEVGVAVLIFVTLGRLLEAHGKQLATRTLEKLDKLLPDQVLRQTGDEAQSIPLADVRVGDVLIVRAGERVPCDGAIESHAAVIDDQIWTGESRGRSLSPGSAVRAGSMNVAGDLYLRASALPSEGALARLTEIMRLARLSSGRYERLADRLATAFLPIVFVVAIAAGVYHGWVGGLDRGILASLSVALISCPCALGIATPLAVWAALGLAAQRRVLFRNGDALERLAGLRILCFDKTGTLTEGTRHVAAATFDADTPRDDVVRRTATLAAASHHVLSKTIRSSLAVEPIPDCPVETLAGRGLVATIAGETTWLGSPRLLAEQRQTSSPLLSEALDWALRDSASIVGVAWGGRVRAWFRVDETLRPGVDALDQIRELGLAVHVLTGDHRGSAERIAGILNVPVSSELLPEDKWRRLTELRRQFGPIGMVGDGVNDGPALAAADLGVALGCGADLARDSAGLCLLGDDLAQLPWAIRLARRTVHVIRLNLFWALIYNVVGVGLACMGRLNPVWAAFAMAASSVLVVVNSLRLTRDETPAPTSVLAAPAPVRSP